MNRKLMITGLFVIAMQIANVSYAQTFGDVEKAKVFFEKMDDEYNKAMVDKDSLVFERHLANSYINCTPQGNINDKKAEIKTLMMIPLSKVERTAPKFSVFAYSQNLASFSVVKKLTDKNGVVAYVRRTTVYQIVNGKWQGVSGQGTIVPAKFVE